FFDEGHYDLARRLVAWLHDHRGLIEADHTGDLERYCRQVLGALGEAGFLDFVVPNPEDPLSVRIDVRSICIIREALAFDSGLIDSMFVMQGLGTSPIWRHSDPDLRREYLLKARQGELMAALALTERHGGSDVANVATRALPVEGGFRIDGEKSWITNGGMADFYVTVARTGDAPGAGGLSVFLVGRDAKGLEAGPQLDMVAAHPIANLQFNDCRVAEHAMIGEPGAGFKLAMAGFDIFRPSVGAAAVGMARRALAESVDRVHGRKLFGSPMSDHESVRVKVADMAVETDSAAMMVYRAAWSADKLGKPVSTQSAMAKLMATEAAQRVIDAAVQLFGAEGVWRGSIIENLYRDVRPTRIYEGASEIQKVVIARGVLGRKSS
ncbi:MAG: acyl-CoA dehydrogenase family protein, partial [Novosphingobium sp.]